MTSAARASGNGTSRAYIASQVCPDGTEKRSGHLDYWLTGYLILRTGVVIAARQWHETISLDVSPAGSALCWPLLARYMAAVKGDVEVATPPSPGLGCRKYLGGRGVSISLGVVYIYDDDARLRGADDCTLRLTERSVKRR